MADTKPKASDAAKADTATQEAVPVEGPEVKGGKVVAVAPQPEATGEAQPTVDQAAKAPPADDKLVANVGVLRVETAAEKRLTEAGSNAEANVFRDPKEAHAEAAGMAVLATTGTEFRMDGTEDGKPVRVRLLFDWHDGQGVFHPRGGELDLPHNEASVLIGGGRGERANPPELAPVEKAVAEATVKALGEQAKA